MPPISNLPEEMWSLIVDLCDAGTMRALYGVCRMLRVSLNARA